jgi:multiple sugar transport system permease protein/putative chitobiose transport system permease protein
MKINISEIIRIALIFLFAIFFLFPLIWVTVSAFKPMDRIMADVIPLSWKTIIPTPFTLDAFKYLYESSFKQSMLLTIFVGLMTVFIGLFLNSMAGFSFAIFNFPGKKILFTIVIITFLVPFEAIAIPLYILVGKLGMINTIYALIIPAISNGLTIFLYRQFFLGIPNDLKEAAIIDGAGWFRVYWQIYLPLSKPVAISAGLLLFLSQWHAFVWPLLATQSVNLRMVQVWVAYSTVTEYTVIWNYLLAASAITAIIPIILIFPLQKYFIRGISASGLKG